LFLKHNFLGKPIILKSPVPTISTYLWQTIVITCVASGFPQPFINWRHNWGNVCEEPRCKITNYANGTSAFTIADIQAKDAGAYSCEIQNKIDRIFAVDTIVTINDGMLY
jgi:hypothetical protein